MGLIKIRYQNIYYLIYLLFLFIVKTHKGLVWALFNLFEAYFDKWLTSMRNELENAYLTLYV